MCGPLTFARTLATHAHDVVCACQTDPAYQSFEALRIFHTSHLRENGNSEMSAKWCMERGLLKKEFAQKLYAV
jgi:hypothetical protein